MKSPAFQFYPKDLLGEAKIAVMDNRTFGVYWRLVCYAWEEPLPDDPKELAKMVNETPKTFEKMWDRIRKCFVATEKGLVHPHLEQERVNQQLRRDQASKAGKKGAEKRWGSHSDPTVLPMAENSPSSSSTTTKQHTWLSPFVETWEKASGGYPVIGKLIKPLDTLVKQHGADAVLKAWERYLHTTETRYLSASDFAAKYGQWHKKRTQRLSEVS